MQTIDSLNFKGKAFNPDAKFLSGNYKKVIEASIKQLNEMNIVKNAECDIFVSKDIQGYVTVSAQKSSDYCKDPHKLWRADEFVPISQCSVISAAKRVIEKYNKNILPLYKNPEQFHPELRYERFGTPSICAVQNHTKHAKESFWRRILSVFQP